MKAVTKLTAVQTIIIICALAGQVEAAPIDTIFFNPTGVIIDADKKTVKYEPGELIREEGRPPISAVRLMYHRAGSAAGNVSGRVLQADTLVLGFHPAPAVADLTTSDGSQSTASAKLFFEYNSLYPDKIWLATAAVQRERTIWSLTLFPLQFAGNDTIVFNRCIEVSTEDLTDGPAMNTGPPEPVVTPDPVAFRATSTAGLPLGDEYLIVTSASLADALAPLAGQKRRAGFSTALVTIDSILAYYTGRDNAEALRNFLKDFYLAGGRYVLLGGDETQLPVRYAYYYNTSTPPELGRLMLCDLYFAEYDGDWDFDGDGIWGEPTQDHPDLAPEVALGRLPFHEPAQIRAYIDKLERYQFDPGDGDRDYLNRGLFFTSDQMRDFSDTGQQYLVAANFPDGYSTDCGSLAEAPTGNDPSPIGPSAEQAETSLSDGYGMVNILAHGRPDGFVINSSVYNEYPKTYLLTGEGNMANAGFVNLERNNKAGFYYTIACEQGAYDLETLYGMTVPSTVEELVALDSAGAVGMVAFTRWGWVSSSYKLMASFYEHLFTDAGGYPAVAMALSWLDYPYYRDQIYGQNYFGDPSLRLYLDRPAELTLDFPGEVGLTRYLEGVVRLDGAPILGQKVVAALDDTLFLTAVSNAEGVVAFDLSDGFVGTVRLTSCRAGAVGATGTVLLSIAADADDDTHPLPRQLALYQNYPNPFNPTTTIAFSLSQGSDVRLVIYDILGRETAVPVDGYLAAGEQTVVWNGLNQNGQSASSGIYFYRLMTDQGTLTKKMVLVK